jgi:hypothetical protein
MCLASINLPTSIVSPQVMIAALKDSPSDMKIGQHAASRLGSGKEIAIGKKSPWRIH